MKDETTSRLISVGITLVGIVVTQGLEMLLRRRWQRSTDDAVAELQSIATEVKAQGDELGRRLTRIEARLLDEW